MLKYYIIITTLYYFHSGFALCWSLVNWNLRELNSQGLYPHHREQRALHLHRGNELTELPSLSLCQNWNCLILSESLKFGWGSFQVVMKQLQDKTWQKMSLWPWNIFKPTKEWKSECSQSSGPSWPDTCHLFPQLGPHAEPPSALSSALRTSSSSAVPMRRPYITKLVMQSWIESCVHTGLRPAKI